MRNQPVREAMNGFFRLGTILRKLIECVFKSGWQSFKASYNTLLLNIQPDFFGFPIFKPVIYFSKAYQLAPNKLTLFLFSSKKIKYMES